MIDDLEAEGWRFAHAYGNAPSDIEAFQTAGVPSERIIHVGRLAGTIPDVPTLTDAEAYTAHLPHLDEVVGDCP